MGTQGTLVIAISRQIGAGGAYVGQALARRLGIRYVDREILQKAAELLGQDAGDLEPLEERATTLWDRIASILSLGAPEAPFVPPPLPTVAEDELFAVESSVMREIAAREDAVFLGRGAAWVLRDHPGVLRVYLHAAEDVRVERLCRLYGVAEANARQLIHRTDLRRAKFLESIAGEPWTAGHNDLCLNTGTLELDPVVDLVAMLAQVRRGRA